MATKTHYLGTPTREGVGGGLTPGNQLICRGGGGFLRVDYTEVVKRGKTTNMDMKMIMEMGDQEIVQWLQNEGLLKQLLIHFFNVNIFIYI